jgi:quercetin dioxygenase-like cupin family protein
MGEAEEFQPKDDSLMSEEATPAIVGPGEGTTIEGPVGGPMTYKLRPEQSGGRQTAFEMRIAPGEGPPLHKHANEDETFYVIEGRLRFKLGEEIGQASEGSFVFVPRGTQHCFQNVGSEMARILVSFTPSGMEGFFDRFAQLEEADPEAFARLGREVGMDIVGPPLAESDPL